MTMTRAIAFFRKRFTRVTSSVAYIPQIDGLRALALLLVIGHHVFAVYLQETHRLGTQLLPRDWSLIAPRSPLVSWGLHLAFGVPIFFTISGFVLAMPFARSAMDKATLPATLPYLLRRLIRLEPPYVLNMTLLFLFIAVPWHQPRWYFQVVMHNFGPHYLASLVYLHAQIFKEPSWINGIAWTLEIEVQFYLLMPLIARLFKLRQSGPRRCLFFALVASTALFSQFGLPYLHNPRLDFSLAGHLEFFLAGVLLADLYLDPPRSLRLTPNVADAGVLASAALIVYILHWNSALAWLQPFLVAALFFAVFRGRWAGRVFSLRCLTLPGTMCYTLYLYHYFLIAKLTPLAIRIFPPAHALWLDTSVQMLLLLPPLLLVSAILYLTTERPFIVLSHEATRRWRPVAAAPEVRALEVGV